MTENKFKEGVWNFETNELSVTKEKSAHEKLLELGWVCRNTSDKKGNPIGIEYKKTVDEHGTVYHVIKIDLESKMFNAWRIYKDYLKHGFWDSIDSLWIDKDLAEILLQYLEELK